MKIRKWLIKEKRSPIYVCPGDTIALRYNGETIVKSEIKNEYIFDEVAIFEASYGNKDAIGGLFLGKRITK